MLRTNPVDSRRILRRVPSVVDLPLPMPELIGRLILFLSLTHLLTTDGQSGSMCGRPAPAYAKVDR